MADPRPQTQPRHAGGSARSRYRLQLLRANAALAQSRDQAVEAHRAKSAFLASLSHLLRTPLSSILLCSEMLAEDLRRLDLADLTADAVRINEAGRLLLAMLDDVLDLTRLEAGRMRFTPVDTDLAALAGQLAEAFGSIAQCHGNTLVMDLDRAPAQLRTDPDKLGRILFHLINNGLKFTRAGTVTLEIRTEGAGTLFTVRDTGIGMSPEQVERIRRDFAQTRHSHPDSYGSAGLGLTLCNVLAHGLGGRLRIESPDRGGSTFTLYLRAPGATRNG